MIIKQLAYSQNSDINWLLDIQQSRKKEFNTFFQSASFSVYPMGIVVPLTYTSLWLIKKDIKYYPIAMESVYALSSQFIINLILKYSFHRLRPYETYSFIVPLKREHTPSFPSGHTSVAFSIATTLSLNFPKWYFILPAYFYAGLVGYSRLYMGVHYPSDILTGAFIGTACSFLTHKIQKYIIGIKKEKSIIIE